MPPEDSNKELSDHEIELLKKWIEDGAQFSQHWAFVPPTKPEPPRNERVIAENAIDYFIAARLAERGLSQSPKTDRETLIRRVTYDLTGLPPTIEEIDAFLADDSPDAYEKVVDRLLRSPRYGEHMARFWLDAARYGDTHGLHLDNQRQIWPYRDWVIDAYNRNMPFDQYTIEQLAGDLLENPTIDQRVATGFNRCNVTTGEGGSINEEYRVRYAVDRVETTSTVFMGLTTGCAVCHDHKFDPISQAEFYQLYAYFYNFAEREMDGNALLPPPVIAVPTEEYEQQRAEIVARLNEIEASIAALVQTTADGYAEPEEVVEIPAEPSDFVWIDDAAPDGAKLEGNTPWNFVDASEHPVHHGEKATYRQANGLSQHFFTGASQTLTIGQGDRLFAYVYLDADNPPKEIMLQFNDGSSWDHRAYWGENRIDWGQNDAPSRRHMGELPEAGKWVRLEVTAEAVGLPAGTQVSGWAFTQFDGAVYWDYAGIVTKTPQNGSRFRSKLQWESVVGENPNAGLPEAVNAALSIALDQRSLQQDRIVLSYFVEHVHEDATANFGPLHQERDAVRKSLTDLEATLPQTLVMEDKPRDQWKTAYVLTRGEYDTPDMDQPVEPQVPAFLPELLQAENPSRLHLAEWLVNGEHPLTARVAVNRYWQQLFGTGIVKTSEDFGSQGEFPTHPELLDWLAVTFVESGWDTKAMLKLMVMSHTYRQSSNVLTGTLANRRGQSLLRERRTFSTRCRSHS